MSSYSEPRPDQEIAATEGDENTQPVPPEAIPSEDPTELDDEQSS